MTDSLDAHNAPPAVVLDSSDLPSARRAPRAKAPPSLKAEVDGQPATLVDFSKRGAQIITTQRLRPEQRIRVFLPDAGQRITARVTRSTFEMSGGSAHYRVGVEFDDRQEFQGALQEHLSAAEELL